jgi:hypothetical protein
VCPDGSVFVVQSASDIPCKKAKRIEPHEVPPMRPENLPRPYLWEVHREKLDQNNPYNLIDRAEQMRKLGRSDHGDEPVAAAPGAAHATPSAQQTPAPSVAAGPPRATRAQQAPVPLGLGLTDGELRDLFFLVELSQERAPATFTRPAAGSAEGMRVSFAWSQSFEDRLRGAAAPEGSALLFSVQTKGAASFQPNFTFVQGHTTFTPRRDDASQFGVLQGHAGAQGAAELALGYVVLPAELDLARPIDLYWNDRRLAATFRP